MTRHCGACRPGMTTAKAIILMYQAPNYFIALTFSPDSDGCSQKRYGMNYHQNGPKRKQTTFNFKKKIKSLGKTISFLLHLKWKIKLNSIPYLFDTNTKPKKQILGWLDSTATTTKGACMHSPGNITDTNIRQNWRVKVWFVQTTTKNNYYKLNCFCRFIITHTHTLPLLSNNVFSSLSQRNVLW